MDLKKFGIVTGSSHIFGHHIPLRKKQNVDFYFQQYVNAKNASIVLNQTLAFTGESMLSGDYYLISNKILEISNISNLPDDVNDHFILEDQS